MFKDLFLQELRFWFQRPATYFYALSFCSFAFLMMAGSAGWFDPHVNDGKIHELVNSPLGIHKIALYLNKLMMVLLPAIVGSSLYRDYKFRVHSILFSSPVSKMDYLLSRFCAAFLVVVVISLLVILSMAVASLIPGLDPAKTGPFDVVAYSQAWLLYMVPNLFFAGALVFAIVLRFRNIYFAFVAALLPFILQLITENAFSHSPELIAILDPFGQNTVLYHTREWTLVQKNESMLSVTKTIFCNRIIWMVTSLLIMGFSASRFRLHQDVSTGFRYLLMRKKHRPVKHHSAAVDYALKDLKLSGERNRNFLALWHLSKDGLIYVLKSPIFWGTVALAIMAVVFAVGRVTQKGDMILMPITKIILLVPSAFYSVFCMMLIFIYSGLLINRERNTRMNALIDSTPTPFWLYWSSKLLTMIQLVLLLLFIFMVSGIIIQTSQGYFDYELLLYLKYLLGFTLPPLVIWIFASFFVHTVIDHLYIALFILLFGWVGVGGMPQLGIDSYLLRFNTSPVVGYSDMNGFGHTIKAFFVTQGYWFGLGIILLTFVHGLWPVGDEVSISSRIHALKHRMRPGIYALFILGISIMVGSGRLIWQGEKAINPFSGSVGNSYLKTFKRNFEVYSELPTPKIRSTVAEIELYPETQNFEAEGSYQLENPHQVEMDTFMMRLGFDELSSFDLSVPFEIVEADSLMKCYVIKLHQPIPPNGQFELSFHIQNQENTLFERNSGVLKNGTFLKNDIFPRFGYTYDRQLPHPDHVINHSTHYQGPDADLTDLNITIGTAETQYALAPGELINHWKVGNRNYFQYQTTQPMKFSFGINSGIYKIDKSQIEDSFVEIYAHHTTNLQSIRAALASTMAYQSDHFTPYQYDQIRVIEFPDSEGTYATAFANNIPASEIRFVTNTDPTGLKTDLSFYVPAHELIHHWWGSTLIPARAQGATMLTESITEYLSLKVYEKHFGKKPAHQFLTLQHRRYWNGHKHENSIEPPLYLVAPEQQYISYGKGAIVMNGLSQLMGEASFNKFLSTFMHSYERGIPPYPTSVDFMKALQDWLPDSTQSFVLDQFKTVSYLEFEDLTISGFTEGKATISGRIKKFELPQNDPGKTPVERPLDEWIQIGLFDANDQVISVQWVHLIKEVLDFHLTSEVEPARIEIDPNYLILIKNRAATISGKH